MFLPGPQFISGSNPAGHRNIWTIRSNKIAGPSNFDLARCSDLSNSGTRRFADIALVAPETIDS
jgi:hypothetical protein